MHFSIKIRKTEIPSRICRLPTLVRLIVLLLWSSWLVGSLPPTALWIRLPGSGGKTVSYREYLDKEKQTEQHSQVINKLHKHPNTMLKPPELDQSHSGDDWKRQIFQEWQQKKQQTFNFQQETLANEHQRDSRLVQMQSNTAEALHLSRSLRSRSRSVPGMSNSFPYDRRDRSKNKSNLRNKVRKYTRLQTFSIRSHDGTMISVPMMSTVLSRSTSSPHPFNEHELLGWNAWSSWSECSKTCGEGQVIRVRQCIEEKYCDLNSFESEHMKCNDFECSLSEWSNPEEQNRNENQGREGRLKLLIGGPDQVATGASHPAWWKGPPQPTTQPSYELSSASHSLLTEATKRPPILKHASVIVSPYQDRSSTSSSKGISTTVLTTPIEVTVSTQKVKFPDQGQESPGWRIWSSWSECSKSCGGGQQMRVRQCEHEHYCELNSFEIDNKDCNVWECLSGEWGDWGECEDGWRIRERCDEEWNCETQDEECEVKRSGRMNNEWSEWGECDNVLGRRTRERCTEDFGCEEEEEECDRKLSWSDWGPCENGLQVRQKCLGANCVEEEVQECYSNEWGEWGECNNGKQERTRCTWKFGCESEEQKCGLALEAWHWTKWTECDNDGFQSRQKCSHTGQPCFYEDRECGENDQDNKWTEWGECKSGFQEREKCEDNYCTLDTRTCSSPEDDSVWTDWGSCGEDGRQARMGWNSEFTVSDERLCEDEDHQHDGGWWTEEEGDEMSLDYEFDDGYWDSDDNFFDSGISGMNLDMQGWAYSL